MSYMRLSANCRGSIVYNATKKHSASAFVLVISSADEIVDRYSKENAQLNQRVIIGLISADFPTRYGGF